MQTSQNYSILESIFPLLKVLDGVIISKRGDVTIGWELTLPHKYSLTSAQYDDMLSCFASAIKVLPPWTLIHRQDIYTYESYRGEYRHGFLGKSYEAHFEGRRHLVHRAFLYLTFTGRSSALKPTASCGIFGIKGFSKMPDANTLEGFRQGSADFLSVLTSGGKISARPLTDTDLLGDEKTPGLLQYYLMLGSRDLITSNIDVGRDRVKLYGKTAIAFSISETDPLPGSISSTLRTDSLSTPVSDLSLGFGSQLGSELDCEHIVNHYILTCNQTAVMQSLDRKRRRMTSMSRNAENRVGAEEIQEFMNTVQTKGLTSVRSHLNLIVWGKDNEVTDLKGKVSAALSPLGITGLQNTCDMPVLWYSGIPGAGCELGEDNLMLMELKSALALGIYETFETGISGGKFKLCDRFRHIPLSLDFQERAMSEGLIGNLNAFILGASGTGKSFSTNCILRNLYDSGEILFVIDAGDSYQGLCSVIREESGGKDGFYYSWDRKHPLSFNPFLGCEDWLDEQGNLNLDNTSVNFFLSFLKTCWIPRNGWTSDTTTILCQMLSDFLAREIKRNEQLILDDFYQYIVKVITPDITEGNYHVGELLVGPERFDVTAFALALQPYSEDGSYGFLLNDRHPKDLLSSRFTVFEVDQLSQADPKFYSLCILCIMNAFDVKMRSLQGTKVMVIEEAWKAIANETMAPYLAGLWKTARKFRTSAVVVTQQISDILSSEVIRDTILKNSDVRILLDQSGNQNRFDEIGDLLGLSPHERSLVLSINRSLDPSLRYKELFITLGGKRSGVYAVEVSPQEAVAYESDKMKKKPFLELCEATLSPVEAIRQIVSKKR